MLDLYNRVICIIGAVTPLEGNIQNQQVTENTQNQQRTIAPMNNIGSPVTYVDIHRGIA
jgi:hypothetical protein